MLHEILTDRATWIIAALLTCCVMLYRAAWRLDRARAREGERQAAIARLKQPLPGYRHTPISFPRGLDDVLVEDGRTVRERRSA